MSQELRDKIVSCRESAKKLRDFGLDSPANKLDKLANAIETDLARRDKLDKTIAESN